MDLFPSTLSVQIDVIIIIILLCELRHVTTESAHENHGYQTNKEDYHHERIEDGKPMNLVLKEFVVKISIKSLFKVAISRLPFHGVGELKRDTRFERNRVTWLEIDFDYLEIRGTGRRSDVRGPCYT